MGGVWRYEVFTCIYIKYGEAFADIVVFSFFFKASTSGTYTVSDESHVNSAPIGTDH